MEKRTLMGVGAGCVLLVLCGGVLTLALGLGGGFVWQRSVEQAALDQACQAAIEGLAGAAEAATADLEAELGADEQRSADALEAAEVARLAVDGNTEVRARMLAEEIDQALAVRKGDRAALGKLALLAREAAGQDPFDPQGAVQPILQAARVLFERLGEDDPHRVELQGRVQAIDAACAIEP